MQHIAIEQGCQINVRIHCAPMAIYCVCSLATPNSRNLVFSLLGVSFALVGLVAVGLGFGRRTWRRWRRHLWRRRQWRLLLLGIYDIIRIALATGYVVPVGKVSRIKQVSPVRPTSTLIYPTYPAFILIMCWLRFVSLFSTSVLNMLVSSSAV
jgi:hypothetical protein